MQSQTLLSKKISMPNVTLLLLSKVLSMPQLTLDIHTKLKDFGVFALVVLFKPHQKDGRTKALPSHGWEM
jgi:hypothetical protein